MNHNPTTTMVTDLSPHVLTSLPLMYNDSGGGGGWWHHAPFPSGYSTLRIAATASVVALLIVVVVVGNMLVIVAIARDKALKGLQYWFIASLAVADIIIGAIAMPFSLAKELMGYWAFGELWCSLHAAIDVLACTSSINNICLISLDRYWSITQAVQYLRTRTERRAALMIAFVWLFSALISIPPLLGWKQHQQQQQQSLSDAGHTSQCELSDDLGYVMYSALGSFYIPSIIMIFVYIRIYFAARNRARRNVRKKPPPLPRNPPPTAAEVSTFREIVPVTTPTTAAVVEVHRSASAGVSRQSSVTSRHATSVQPPHQHSASGKQASGAGGGDTCSRITTAGEDLDESSSPESGRHHSQPSRRPRQRGGIDCTCWKRSSSRSDAVVVSSKSTPQPHEPRTAAIGRCDCRCWLRWCCSMRPQAHPVPPTPTSVYCASHEPAGRGAGEIQLEAMGGGTHERLSTKMSRDRDKEKRRLARKKEKRATLILGLIMGSFIACWLPFFMLYVLVALCEQCRVADWGFAIAFWLGYFNSALNPVIYTIFNKDFRKAFRKIVCR